VTGLLNYTTTIPSAKTISEMQSLLAKAGADSIAVHYTERSAAGLTFSLRTKYGPQLFTLPVDVPAVQKVLAKQKPASMSQAKFYSPEHAERVAWRISKTWLEAQLALVSVQMATIDQVMLPYMHVGPNLTFYAAYQDRQDVLELTAGES
jgi:hypothetical protein